MNLAIAPRLPGRTLLPTLALAFVAGAASSTPARSEGPAAAGVPTAARAVEVGLENVSADSSNGLQRIGYENRRYRHPLDAIGHLRAGSAEPVTVVERRLGLPAASIDVLGQADSTRFRVRFPSDADFPGAPKGPVAKPTRHTVDLLLRPNFAYELGRLTAPIQVRWQLEPLIRYSPWPGARATASMMIPIYNQFDPDPLHPDVDNLRPGVATLDQFAWIPHGGLLSATVGLLGDNRFGGSVGAARPLAGGRFIADAQFDLTGFIAFEESGITYSPAKHGSGFGGLAWNVPLFDATLRVRGGQFLYGDRGMQVDFSRSFGDFDYSLSLYRGSGRNVEIVRVTLPVPPLTRATQQVVRVQPIERWSLNYRTDATPLGIKAPGVADREDYLRQLSETGLAANRYRLDRAGRKIAPKPDTGLVPWVNSTGMTGFVFTPWAGVLPSGTISVDYTDVPAKWSYSGRGQFVNQAYSLTIGLLPRIEASLRFTRLPGAFGFIEDIDNLITTDTDHMASGRLVLLTPRNGRPGLALGIEDVSGTRRFHSTYAVAGMPLKINLMQTRFSFGYAPRVFTATRHVLDGGFGALEVSPWRVVAGRVEYDSEKWNVGAGVVLPLGLRLRVAALNLETLSAGAGWTHGL